MLEASRYTFADRNAYLADPDFFDVPLAGLLSDSFAAERRALITEHGRHEPGRARRPVRQPEGRREGRQGQRHDQPPAPVHDPPRRVGHEGQRRLVHVHDRVDGRQRDRRARLRLPPEQRADGLQLRLADPPEPRRRRQAAAQLDEPDDRHARRQSRSSRSARRAAPRSPGRSSRCCSSGSTSARRCREAIARPRVVQRNAATSPAEPAFISSPEGQALLARGHSYASTAEIGAVTGIEFLPGGRTVAAAEPVRRGGGSAATAQP